MNEDKADILSSDDKLNLILSRLTSLEEKVDARLKETRPIWESVNTRLDAIETSLRDLGESVHRIDKRLASLERSHYEARTDVADVRVRQQELEERLKNLEERKAS